MELKHTKEYLDARWVIDNPKDYEQQMVFDAQNFVRGYDQALSIFVAVKGNEQLPCDCGVKLYNTDSQIYCPKCFKTWFIKAR